MKTKDAEQMVKDLRDTPGLDEMDFVMEREPQPGRTFSREALNEYLAAVDAFIGARLFHYLDADGPGHSRLRVEVKVHVDEQHTVPEDDRRPWFTIDGTARGAAEQAVRSQRG